MSAVLTSRHGQALIVTLNRPEVRNALSRQMYEGLSAAWDLIDSDPDIKCAILTGAGGAFCAGGDLREMSLGQKAASSGGYIADMEYVFKPTLRSHFLTKPLIAAVEGPCLAGGMEILQATDIRIAGRGARFGLPEVTRGLVPLAGATCRLPRQIPLACAMDILLTGRHVEAEEALRMGIVSALVEKGGALERALQYADLICANGPLAIQAIRRIVHGTMGMSEKEALDCELAWGRDVWDTEDAAEGMRAFVEKRPPRFNGR